MKTYTKTKPTKIKAVFEVDTFIGKETKNRATIPISFNVKGMMVIIERSFPTEDQRILLKEYAKFYLFDKLGVEEWPIKK